MPKQTGKHPQIQQLIDYIDHSPSMFQAVAEAARRLQSAGFTPLDAAQAWRLEAGRGYYMTLADSALIAFIPGTDAAQPFRVIGSHTDSPALKVKANPCLMREGLLQLNVEPYGGLIMRGWLDCPLGLAGRLVIDRGGKPESVNITIDEDLLIIPSLAIHMDRTVNEAGAIQPQNQLLPIYASTGSDMADQKLLFRDLADRLDIPTDAILGHDLFLFPRSRACLIGPGQTLLSAPRIDNLAMVDASLTALIASSEAEVNAKAGVGEGAEPGQTDGSGRLPVAKAPTCHRIIVATDAEEIGSGSRTGADSMTVHNILKRICLNLGGSEEDYWRSLANSFMLSCDASHAVHPAFPDLADPTNRPHLNAGPVIKTAANHSYATDGFSTAFVRLLAREAKVPLQTFHNRSDKRGGSTIGPLTERWLTMPSADIGNPLLAMHAIRELAGTEDHLYMIRLMTAFFASLPD